MRAAALAVLALLLIGCHKASPLVGKWQRSVNELGNSGTHTIEFTEDGKFTSTISMGPLTATDRGTWKLDGSTLTTHFDDVDWQFNGSSANVERARQRFQTNKPKILAQVNEHPTETVTWSGNDQLTTKDSSGKSQVFTRVK